MTQTFTENDLLRYAYGETSGTENVEIKKSLLCDDLLQDTYNQLIATLAELDKCAIKPGDSAVQRILDYSKSSNLPPVLK